MRIVVIGAGFAGACTAAALADRGRAVSGIILEREAVPGAHASGKNAGIARQVEFDPVVRALAVRSLRLWSERADARPVVTRTGGLYLSRRSNRPRLDEAVRALARDGIACEILERPAVVGRWKFLEGVSLECAVWCAHDGIADIHAMLLSAIDRARAGGFVLRPRTEAQSLVVIDGRVAGVRTSAGPVAADVVVDAAGAWAGLLGAGRGSASGLVPVRRHLFTTSRPGEWPADAPVVWHLDEGFYVRPEGAGLLCSPCDETSQPPGDPVFDPEAEELLAEKLTRHGGLLAGVEVRRGWPCLRTFAPDRRPVIGWDRRIEGLFHVSGLGGFGMTASAAVGELAAALIAGDGVDAALAAAVSPARFAE